MQMRMDGLRNGSRGFALLYNKREKKAGKINRTSGVRLAPMERSIEGDGGSGLTKIPR